MSKSILNPHFNFANMINIVKHGKSYLPICKIITQHLLDSLEVAICKLELLIKLNKEIDGLIEKQDPAEPILELEKLTARSHELFQEIQHLPIMNEDPAILVEMLPLSRIGSKYSDLLALIYNNPVYIAARNTPFYDTSHLYLR